MIVRYMSPLRVEMIDDNDNWQLIEPFAASVFVPEVKDSYRIITVPAGFKTDFASVPRLPCVYLLMGNKAHKAAVLHDYLYSVGGSEADRVYADEVLKTAAILDGVEPAKAVAMWAAVRKFGESHWAKA